MENYTFSEQTDMILTLGQCHGNAAAAANCYREKFPNRRAPNRKTFLRIETRLRENGTFKPNFINNCNVRSVRTPELEEDILEYVEENTTASTMDMARHFFTSKTTVWRALHEQQLYPYHCCEVQEVRPADYPLRLQYCQIMQHKIQIDEQFLEKVLFTDESTFSKDGIINLRNLHRWAEENPRFKKTSKSQWRFSLNVWAGIVGDVIIGPVFLPSRLDGQTYRRHLEELDDFLDDVPLNTRRSMWYMHDGAPAHSTQVVQQFLRERFPGRWIGRGVEAPISWPPRSPDLTPLDFYLWGRVKSLVYSVQITSVDQLRLRIVDSFDQLRTEINVLPRVRFNLIRRYQACIDGGGNVFEHLL